MSTHKRLYKTTAQVRLRELVNNTAEIFLKPFGQNTTVGAKHAHQTSEGI
jgi:hypothetical protein